MVLAATLTNSLTLGQNITDLKVFSTKDNSEMTVVKVKGFQLDHKTSAAINFGAMVNKVQAFVKSGQRDETFVVLQRIERCAD